MLDFIEKWAGSDFGFICSGRMVGSDSVDYVLSISPKDHSYRRKLVPSTLNISGSASSPSLKLRVSTISYKFKL